MVYSQYNEFIANPVSDTTIYLFNCMSRRWLELDVRLADIIRAHKDSIDELEKIHPELFDAMVEGKFVNVDRQIELGECLSGLDKQLNSKRRLKITINPTLDCNLRCWYCYEKHLDGSCMSEETIHRTIAYLDKILTKEVDYLQLSFFGGEPFLRYHEVIRPIIDRTEKMCKERGVILQLHFTTNATLLSQDILDDLKRLKDRTYFQIAIDGDSECHNRIKFFADGKGSYSYVLANVRAAIKKGYNVSLRCNYSRKSLFSFIRVVEDFKDLLGWKNLRFSFHRIWQESKDDELFEIIRNFKKQIAPYNIKSNLNSSTGNSVNHCYGDYNHNIVINYNGDVFKCTARDFKKEKRLGYLDIDGDICYNGAAIERQRHCYTPYCFGCRILPICPLCSQTRSESKSGKCPIDVDDVGVRWNMRAVFRDISGIKV